MKFKKDDKVKLISFLGKIKPDEMISESENFWKLINYEGSVLELYDKKVLVLFDFSLDGLGLENHNRIKNSLLIDKNDLIIL